MAISLGIYPTFSDKPIFTQTNHTQIVLGITWDTHLTLEAQHPHAAGIDGEGGRPVRSQAVRRDTRPLVGAQGGCVLLRWVKTAPTAGFEEDGCSIVNFSIGGSNMIHFGKGLDEHDISNWSNINETRRIKSSYLMLYLVHPCQTPTNLDADSSSFPCNQLPQAWPSTSPRRLVKGPEQKGLWGSALAVPVECRGQQSRPTDPRTTAPQFGPTCLGRARNAALGMCTSSFMMCCPYSSIRQNINFIKQLSLIRRMMPFICKDPPLLNDKLILIHDLFSYGPR